MKIYSYVVRFDSGFAPNPFGSFCTLATCKPRIRKQADINDWVVGTGSTKNVGNDKLVYAMYVSEKLEFVEYWKDNKFQYKKPEWKSFDPIKSHGDNIYWRDEKGLYHQEPSQHSNKDGAENKKLKEHDLNGKYVLISNKFYYFGKNGIKIPEEYNYIIKKGPGHKCNFTKTQVDNFLNWLSKNYTARYHGDPYLLKKNINTCNKWIKYDGTPENDEE